MTEYKAGDTVRLFGDYLNVCGARKKEKIATIVDGNLREIEDAQGRSIPQLQVKMVDPIDWAPGSCPVWGTDRMELISPVCEPVEQDEIDAALAALRDLSGG